MEEVGLDPVELPEAFRLTLDNLALRLRLTSCLLGAFHLAAQTRCAIIHELFQFALAKYHFPQSQPEKSDASHPR